MANGNGGSHFKAIAFGVVLAALLGLAITVQAQINGNSNRATALETRQNYQDQMLMEIRADVKTLLSRDK